MEFFVNLLFISPKWEKFKHWPYHMSLLGPLTIAGLTPEIHTIHYIDENVQKINFDENPDAVIISAMTVQAQRGYEIASLFMEKNIPVVMGGLHVTLLPDEAKNKVTTVAVGEGELIWGQILNDLENNSLQPFYETTEKFDLSCDTFAFPNRSLLRSVGYTKTMKGQRVIDTIQAGRGCVKNCLNCNVPLVSGRRYRARPIDNVLAEIETIDAKFMFFVDDTIPEVRDYFLELFTAMKGMNKKWMSVGALHVVNDPQFLNAMVESGCKVQYIGFDRLDPSWRVRKKKKEHYLYHLDIKKYDIEFEQDFLLHPAPYYQAIEILKNSGISLIGTFAFGFDHDDNSVFERNIEFALNSKLDLADFTIVVPYPRSPLAIKLERENRINTHDWKLYNGMHVVFKPKQMTEEQLLKGTEWSWKLWNENRPIFRNMIKTFGDF